MMTLVAAVVGLIGAIWVYSDANKRYETLGKPFLWALGVFLGLIICLPLYLIVRPKSLSQQRSELLRCPSCSQYNKVGDTYCKHCGASLAESE